MLKADAQEVEPDVYHDCSEILEPVAGLNTIDKQEPEGHKVIYDLLYDLDEQAEEKYIEQE